jgi:deoxyribodipyrimidine photo-lyase
MTDRIGGGTILWFRKDLRLSDHPALMAAVERKKPVYPVFIWAPEEEGDWTPGGASKWWLRRSLESLAKDLRKKKSDLVLRDGPTLETLKKLVEETGADAVYWSRRYEPAIIERDTQVKQTLKSEGIEVKSFNSALLFEPWEVHTGQGTPYQVFTPFWKSCLNQIEPLEEPLPVPSRIPSPERWPESIPLESLELEPKLNWAKRFPERWKPGAGGARKKLEDFLEEPVVDYIETRNRPDLYGTSRLSPHLHFGEISPREILAAVADRFPQVTRGKRPDNKSGASVFLSEVGWREFAHHLLYHFPSTPLEPLREKFASFPWREDPEALHAWRTGRTGYPIVDAGMRELWATGWMHNRVRMIVASFLTKDLRLPWQEGARWFWDTLVDADLASNTLGWQWTAGCGADAAPYFRVFNPVTQGQKFDPNGKYVREWIPEIASLPDKAIHSPWAAAASDLVQAGIELGKDYPAPIVDHSKERENALEAYNTLK